MGEPAHAASRPLLVVVADDGGIDVARNRGIVEATRRGVVGAISVIAAGAGVHDLIARLRDLPDHLQPEIGLHLCLTEGRALAGPAPRLTDAEGEFLGDKPGFWDRAMSGGIDDDAVRRETLAQLERLDELGLRPSRLDGHQHVHVLPGVRDGVAAALDEAPHVRWVRLGAPVVAEGAIPADFPRLPIDRVASEHRALHAAGRIAQAALGTLHDACGVLLGGGRRSADVFAGADLVVNSTWTTLQRELEAAARQVPAGGVIELMTHPGECDSDSVEFSADPSRSDERDALCADALPDLVARLGLRLGRFADAESLA